MDGRVKCEKEKGSGRMDRGVGRVREEGTVIDGWDSGVS